MQNQNYPYIFEQDNSILNKSKSQIILDSTKKKIFNTSKKNNMLLKQSSYFQNKSNIQIPILTPKQRKSYKVHQQLGQFDKIKDLNTFHNMKQNLNLNMFKSIKIKRQCHQMPKSKGDKTSNKQNQTKQIENTDDLQLINLDEVKQTIIRVDENKVLEILPKSPMSKKIERIKMINAKHNKQQQQFFDKQEIISNQLSYIIKQPNFTEKIINMNDIKNKKQFLTSVIPKGYILQCSVYRDKSWLKSLYPQFHLYVSAGQYLMSSKKKIGHTKSTYIISLNPNDMDTNSDNYLGKLKSDFLGTQFILFDSGTSVDKAEPNRDIRKIIGSVNLKNNKLGSVARLIEVYLPQFNNKIYEFNGNQNEQLNFKQIYQNDKSKLFAFKNKQPIYNQSTKLFNLNFFGRVTKVSMKNFILQELQTQNDEFQYNLMFGKSSDQIFHLDVKYPFSPLQAFGIVLSSFDNKLAFK